MPRLTIDDLQKLRESSKKNLSLREGEFRGKLIVHLGTCGIAAGAREIQLTSMDSGALKLVAPLQLDTEN